MSDYEIIQVLSQYEEQFQVYDLVSYLLRSLGWIPDFCTIYIHRSDRHCHIHSGFPELYAGQLISASHTSLPSQRLCPELLAGSLSSIRLFLFGDRIQHDLWQQRRAKEDYT